MKHIVLLRARGLPEALQQRTLEFFGAAPFDVSVNIVRHDGNAPWHVVIEAWTDQDTLGESLRAAALESLVAVQAIYRVTELVEKDEGPDAGWPVSGVRLIVPWVGRSDVSTSERRRHWNEHVPLANRVHVGVTRYVRNWIEGPVGDDAASAPPYQGIASQHYASERDMIERSFDSPASVQVITDDVADFIAEHVVLLVTEYRHSQRP